MREIEFRGKTIPYYPRSEWVFGYFRQNDNETFIIYDSCLWYCKEVEPETVGQYIGLKDSDGNKIYEGDIVECRYECPGGDEIIHVAEIKYFINCSYPGFVFYPLYVKKQNGDGNGDDSIRVIGNIHDDPELLEKKQ